MRSHTGSPGLEQRFLGSGLLALNVIPTYNGTNIITSVDASGATTENITRFLDSVLSPNTLGHSKTHGGAKESASTYVAQWGAGPAASFDDVVQELDAYIAKQGVYVAASIPGVPKIDEESLSFSNSRFTLYNAGSYVGVISDFQLDDVLDLAGIGTATGATLGANNVLTVTESGGGSVDIDLAPSQNFAGDLFETASDGKGGTDIGLAALSITPSDPRVNEDAGSETFTITRSGNTSAAATVYVSTTDGSTVAGESINSGDFTPLSNQPVTFAAGATTATVSVGVNDLGITDGATKNFGFNVTDKASSTNVLANDKFSIRDNDSTNMDITYSYTGEPFTAADAGDDFLAGNVTAEVTFYNIRKDYTGDDSFAISYSESAYEITNSGSGSSYSDNGLAGYSWPEFTFVDGEIATWYLFSVAQNGDHMGTWHEGPGSSYDWAEIYDDSVPMNAYNYAQEGHTEETGTWAITSISSATSPSNSVYTR